MRLLTEPDPALLNDWHPVAEQEWFDTNRTYYTTLLGTPLAITRHNDDHFSVSRIENGEPVTAAIQYGHVWACLGSPERPIIHIPEADETDRHVVTGGSIGVHASGLRTVENFLDMGHFAFVHDGWLGEEPHTEIFPYNVEITEDDCVLATECKAYQPIAGPSATDGIMVDYIYKVYRPYAVALYKTHPGIADRMDYIGLFVQPVDEEHCVAHSVLCYLKGDSSSDASVRWWMQLIFAQDKPILENQHPKRLPLDPRAETPIRADAASVYYRRWLRDHKIQYGAIPAVS